MRQKTCNASPESRRAGGGGGGGGGRRRGRWFIDKEEEEEEEEELESGLLTVQNKWQKADKHIGIAALGCDIVTHVCHDITPFYCNDTRSKMACFVGHMAPLLLQLLPPPPPLSPFVIDVLLHHLLLHRHRRRHHKNDAFVILSPRRGSKTPTRP
jgi:hypothetical protein